MNLLNVQKLRIIKFLLSILFLSVFFSIVPLLLQSLKPFLAMLAIDKTYMFLLCNGLVVFILKNSGLVHVKKDLEIQNNPNPIQNNPNPPEATEEKEDNRERMVSGEKKEEEEEQGICHAIGAIDEEEEEEDTDELNQKVEEFIRKMKEAISLERRDYYKSGDFDTLLAVQSQLK
ncbi:uncharacterized protein LOC114712360 [Neltuma alba]|uniref:uncharacterized protein LOC114712360 n=1 Tax=Neltuma alba TaxID=207710 RepID=UPI0010A38A6C|nr:uncharacterized protein LOC114712360 [Prosopis alba]